MVKQKHLRWRLSPTPSLKKLLLVSVSVVFTHPKTWKVWFVLVRHYILDVCKNIKFFSISPALSDFNASTALLIYEASFLLLVD